MDLEAVEAANEPLTTEVLVDTLVALEPSFEKFKQVLYSIPKEKIRYFIQILLTIIPLVISYKTLLSTDENHREDIALQKEQQNLARKQFEYQKSRDADQDRIRLQTEKKLEEIKLNMDALQRNFENQLLTLENKPGKSNSTIALSKKLKGNCRNTPCLCGSGKKSKKCHPNGYVL